MLQSRKAYRALSTIGTVGWIGDSVKKERIAALALLSACLIGCSSNPSSAERAAAQAEIQRTTPTCHSDQECKLKWAAARNWILANSPMKLQHITDDYLETYNPPMNTPQIAVRVQKQPLDDGSGYTFPVTVWCDNMFGCVPNQWDAALNYNRTVNAVKAPSF